MEPKDMLLKLRLERGLTQEELAERLFVTRQAVSRWETGETVPGVETLKLLSRLFDVSINALLGSREPDGAFNEDYCKWCYEGGRFAYSSVEQLADFLAGHMSSPEWPREAARSYFLERLPQLEHWQEHR